MPADTFAATTCEMLVGGLLMLPLGTRSRPTRLARRPRRSSPGSTWSRSARSSATRPTRGCSHHAPLGTVSTYAYVNPVVAIILGVLFRDESLTTQILVGAAIVVASVAVVVRQEPPAATAPEEGVR